MDSKTILWAAIEDYAGLWEAVWELRTLHPDAEAGVLELRARRVVEQLVSEGYVVLYRCHEPYGDMVEVAHSEAQSLLAADTWWKVPEGEVLSVRFGATPAGERAYADANWQARSSAGAPPDMRRN